MNYRHTSHSKYSRRNSARTRHKVHRVIRFFLFVCSCVLAFYGIRLAIDLNRHGNTFYQGVWVDGVQLTGYSKQQAYDTLSAMANERLNGHRITLSFEGQTWQITPSQIGASQDVADEVEQAWSMGREGNWLERQDVIRRLRSEPVSMVSQLEYDDAALTAFAQSVKEAVDRPMVEATVSMDVEAQKLSVSGEQVGYDLDAEALKQQLIEAMEVGQEEPIVLTPRVIEPERTAQELEQSTVLLASVSTPLKGESNRTKNVRLALSNFNGYTAKAGAEVSFNQVVGKRTKARGYKRAPEYTSTGTSEGIGGGVCQASTTLYNAVIGAGLDVRKRSPHSYTVSYVKPSLDAAVTNTSSKDLVFINNTSATLYFFTEVTSKKATVWVYGKPVDDNLTIEIVSEVTVKGIKPTRPQITYDETKPVGYRELVFGGKDGLKSVAYRIYYDKQTGEEVHRQQLSSDYYEPMQEKYILGSMEEEGLTE